MMLIAACIGLDDRLRHHRLPGNRGPGPRTPLRPRPRTAQIGEGGSAPAALPLLPTGALLLIPLSLAFPGEVNGYGLPGFLRRVNLENGIIRARTLFIKTIATAPTIGSGNSAGVEGPIAQIRRCPGLADGPRLSGSRAGG